MKRKDLPSRNHGQLTSQAQEGPDGLAITEQLCALPSDSSGGHVSATAERKCSLEATTTAASGHYAIETPSDPISAENLDSKGHHAIRRNRFGNRVYNLSWC